MKVKALKLVAAAACSTLLVASCAERVEVKQTALMTVGNPFLPLWEHIPDGEPYVFEDPDNPGKQRVYLYGSHDNLKTEYCGFAQFHTGNVYNHAGTYLAHFLCHNQTVFF